MAAQKIDPKSTDYDFNDIEPDERMTQTTKEFWITMGTYCVFIVLMIGNLFIFGADPENYTYVLGFPLWIFLRICIIVAMVVAVLVISQFVYRDMDITPHGKIYPRGVKPNPDSNQ